jgi:HAD superfamily hydrolase (TIGR01509 family)
VSPRAVIFDFNGTISDDEPLLFRVFRDVLAEHGVALGEEDYFAELAGFSDPEIAERALRTGGLEPDRALVEEVLRAKIDGYRDAVQAEATISSGAADFVRAVAARVPVAIASGAFREEVELVLELAGLRDIFGNAIVCIDDVDSGKPDPAGYLLALARLNEDLGLHESIVAAAVLAIEDSRMGVEAAHAAGLRCAALAGDERAEAAADFVIERLDAAAAVRLLDS